MRRIERPIGSGRPAQNSETAVVSGLLGKTIARARDALSARFGYIEWVLLAAVVLLPTAFIWHFASPGYFLSDDFHNLYWASNADDVGSFLFGASYSDHLSPGHRLVYLVLQRVAPMNFDVAVAFLLLCHAGSAVLLQRILALFFGRVWWTYALTLAWAMSVVYVAASCGSQQGSIRSLRRRRPWPRSTATCAGGRPVDAGGFGGPWAPCASDSPSTSRRS